MFELRDLECFLAIVEQKSFHGAAKRLNMAQPPLSRRIAALERELGGPLFSRAARQIELTEIGRVFAEEARIVLAQANLARRIVHDIGRGFKGHLRLGYNGSSGYSVVPIALASFHEDFPRATITVLDVLSPRQPEALRAGTIDVALHRGTPDAAGLNVRQLRTDRLLAVMPPTHHLASQKVIPVEALANELFVSLTGDSPGTIPDMVRVVCARAGFAPNVVQIVDTVATLLACVELGMGIALLNIGGREPPWRVTIREIDPPAPAVPFSALTRANETNPLVPDFIEHLVAAVRTNR